MTEDQQKEQSSKDQTIAQKWLAEIARIRSKEKKWREQARKVIERYRDDRDWDSKQSKMNILWSNTETIKPAIFSRMPVPDVRRRWSTRDPAARTAALIIERSLVYLNSVANFRDVLNRSNEDYVLPGRAMAQVCYYPTLATKRKKVDPLPPSDPPEDDKYPEGTLVDEQGGYQEEEYKAWESVVPEYVNWELFGFSECASWDKCPAAWTGEYLTRDDIAKLAPQFDDYDGLSFSTEVDEDKKDQPPQTVLVWKVWHKAARKLLLIAENYSKAPLAQIDDPLQLENFYPFPEPMYSLRNNGKWTPKPEFLLYQDQAIELDIITERMRQLTSALKVRGVYDKAMDTVAKISELPHKGDNEFIPVDNFSQLAEKGGLEGLIAMMPLEQIAAVLVSLREREGELKQEIYEIYGIADIMRGVSEASETLGAQQLKAQYGALRISTRQDRFQEFIRELYRIEAEIVCEHFDPETLKLMTGLQVITDMQFEQLKAQKQLPAGAVSESEFAQAIQIIRSDKLRGFKVDIETDSTVPVDKQAEQENRVAFIGALGTYLQGVLPAIEQGAIPASVAREAMLFVIRGFKVGTELEEVLEQLGDDDDTEDTAKIRQQLQYLQAKLQETQQENQELKAGAEVELQKAQIKAQTDIAANDSKMALEQQKHGLDTQLAAQTAEREQATQEAEYARQMQLEQLKIDSAERLRAMELENERLIADAKNQTAIMIAEISANASLQAAAMKPEPKESDA